MFVFAKMTSQSPVSIHRHDLHCEPDSSRVLLRAFIPQPNQRIVNVIARVLSLSEEETECDLAAVMEEFGSRHANIDRLLRRHFEKVRAHLPTSRELSPARQLLIGALFTGEY